MVTWYFAGHARLGSRRRCARLRREAHPATLPADFVTRKPRAAILLAVHADDEAFRIGNLPRQCQAFLRLQDAERGGQCIAIGAIGRDHRRARRARRRDSPCADRGCASNACRRKCSRARKPRWSRSPGRSSAPASAAAHCPRCARDRPRRSSTASPGAATPLAKISPPILSRMPCVPGALVARRDHRFADDVTLAERIDIERARGKPRHGVRGSIQLPSRLRQRAHDGQHRCGRRRAALLRRLPCADQLAEVPIVSASRFAVQKS